MSAADFNFGWRFFLGDSPTASDPAFDDSTWRSLRLPHDWSVEAAYDAGLEGATAYLPGGVGWYRKRFSLPADDALHFIYFDGVYNNTTVWLNGHELGSRPYGYSPFYFDMTPYLEQENLLAVRVDHSRYADSRWYTGSGIYRNVTLIRKAKLHMPIWGSYLTTPEVGRDKAALRLELSVSNRTGAPVYARLKTTVLTPAGETVGRAETNLSLNAAAGTQAVQEVQIIRPELWSPESPSLYRAVTSLSCDGETVDTHETPFGVRSAEFTADRGFLLNGEPTLIRGVCLHHDAGLVGAAVPDAVWRRRLETLKRGGCNAVRTAHHPASAAFLDLCDELGLLVQEEFFDDWDYPKDKRFNKGELKPDPITDSYTRHFRNWAERDLKNTVLRDRNHPCIIQWSIGNEIEWTYERYTEATGYFNPSWQGNYFFELPPRTPEQIRQYFADTPETGHSLAATAERLARWTRELDRTRPIINNCIFPSSSHVTGYADAVDIMGYSYRRVLYDYGHEHYPDKPIMGTENVGQWHEWRAVLERPFIAGIFLWTGVDYLGEAHDKWPKKMIDTGLLDLAGFKKPSFHMFKSLWTDEPTAHIYTQTLEHSLYTLSAEGDITAKDPDAWKTALWKWHDVNEHWNYSEDETVAVEVYSNCAALELRLNGESLGVKRLEDFADHIYKWAVPFRAGTLSAVSEGGLEVSLHTAGAPAAVRLSADAYELSADAYDCVHVTAQLCDAEGRPVRHVDEHVQFEVRGEGRALGVDNGSGSSVVQHQAPSLPTHKGRALLIVQANKQAGTLQVKVATSDGANSPDLTGDSLNLAVKMPAETFAEVTP